MIRVTGECVQRFVERGLWGDDRYFSNCTAIGYADDNGLTAGVVFHNYDPDNAVIELSAYSDSRNWLTRARLLDLFDYPFNQLDLRICVARCSEHNTRALRIWRALGSSQHRLPDLRGEGEAEVVSILKRAEFYSRFKEPA